MAEFILFLAVAGLALWLFLIRGEIAYLRRRVTELEDNRAPRAADPEPVLPMAAEPVEPFKVAAKASTRKTAAVVRSAEVSPPPTVPVEPVEIWSDEPSPAFKNPLAGASFEDLVGGKLPIWIGGIALIFAGFFLVRYTIEVGLLGPDARSIIATFFALLLIALSDFGGKLPKLGESFTADPRVGQSLAGAGVATLYGTLYMASEIYGLVAMPMSFILVVAVTSIAFALSLRHGPPTALMGLIGGFAAPWVAGMGASNLPTLLLYLAVFIAALFGLAIWRRWLWLLVLASGGGAAWSFAMLLSADGNLSALGLFILLVAAAAIFTLDRFGETESRWADVARFAPMALALVQLAMLLPQMEFSPMAWTFYGALSALALALAWRDTRHMPILFGALLLCLVPLGTGWDENGPTNIMIAATLGLGLLFGVPAHLRARNENAPRNYWAMLALLAQLVPFVAAFLGRNGAFEDNDWGLICALLVAPAAWIAWQWRQAESRTDSAVQLASAGLAAAMAWMALGFWLPEDVMATGALAIAAALAAWATQTVGKGISRLAAIPLIIGGLMILFGSLGFLDAFGNAISGQRLMLSRLPLIEDAALRTLLPSTVALGIAFLPMFRLGNWMRPFAGAVGGTGVAAFIWLLAKQVSGIDSPSQFIMLGFAERVVITQLLFIGGWIAFYRAGAWSSPLAKLGSAAFALALLRLVWLDLVAFNPVIVPQAVGPAPIANLATIHLGLSALWLWLVARLPLLRALGEMVPRLVEIASLGLMVLTALATVRQLMQGSILSGGVLSTGENYLYSAALLALSIGWLARGMMAGSKLLRLAGLALLTAVTLKVFLIDAAALTGVLRILSFLGLGIALIGIGWAYGRVMGTAKGKTES
jgi:uncharacterized membrane protein